MRISRSAIIICSLLLAACAGNVSNHSVLPGPHPTPTPTSSPTISPLSKIQHIVVIEMENRSFDTYFGTFPGVNGIPPNPNCNPDPRTQKCILPYHEPSLTNQGGPHSTGDMFNDIDGGKLDGFVKSAAGVLNDPTPDDVMGYHTCAELPVYCQLASGYTLADNHFAASNSWSAIAHLYLVSAWSAICASSDPMSCVSSNRANPDIEEESWTDITWLLHAQGISWHYYLYRGSHQGPLIPGPTGGDGEGAGTDNPSVPNDWNPLPAFDDVKQDGQLSNIVNGAEFLTDAKAGLLPAVSWVIPSFKTSEHPPESVAAGQTWVTQQLQALAKGPDASSTIVLLTWDEWGGFYDHVIPIQIDGGGYGFRTPLIIIGPMVKKGYIDHQLLTSDSYMKLIEDRFLGGQRLDPATDGRADPRPDVREMMPGLGDIRNDLIGN